MLHATSAPPGNGSPATTTTVDVTVTLASWASMMTPSNGADCVPRGRRSSRTPRTPRPRSGRGRWPWRPAFCRSAADAVRADPGERFRAESRPGRGPAGSRRGRAGTKPSRSRCVADGGDRRRGRRRRRRGARRLRVADVSPARRSPGSGSTDPRSSSTSSVGQVGSQAGGGGRASGASTMAMSASPAAMARRLASCDPVNVTSRGSTPVAATALIHPDRLSTLLAASRPPSLTADEHAAVAMAVGIGEPQGEGADDGRSSSWSRRSASRTRGRRCTTGRPSDPGPRRSSAARQAPTATRDVTLGPQALPRRAQRVERVHRQRGVAVVITGVSSSAGTPG